MERTHSWHVVCVEIDGESPLDDCRQIEEIGYLAPTLRLKPAQEAASMIDSGLSKFHIELEGDEIPLQAAKDSRMYVRTMDEDSKDDPLLALPTTENYKSQLKLKNI